MWIEKHQKNQNFQRQAKAGSKFLRVKKYQRYLKEIGPVVFNRYQKFMWFLLKWSFSSCKASFYWCSRSDENEGNLAASWNLGLQRHRNRFLERSFPYLHREHAQTLQSKFGRGIGWDYRRRGRDLGRPIYDGHVSGRKTPSGNTDLFGDGPTGKSCSS